MNIENIERCYSCSAALFCQTNIQAGMYLCTVCGELASVVFHGLTASQSSMFRIAPQGNYSPEFVKALLKCASIPEGAEERYGLLYSMHYIDSRRDLCVQCRKDIP